MTPHSVILVTGASGFIGQALCRQLVRRGHRVRALIRHAAHPIPAGATPAFAAGLDDRAALATAVDGVRAVVHLAARVHLMREIAPNPLQAYRQVNVEGTRVLLSEARRAGVQSFVLASSVKAVGESTCDPWTEATTPQPSDPYGIPKLEAEQVVLEPARGSSLVPTVLRLPLVYGPEAKGNVPRLLRLVKSGLPLPFGGIQNRRSMLFLGNAVSAISRIVGGGPESGGLFFLADNEVLSTPALLQLVARTLHCPCRLVPAPRTLFHLAGALGDQLAAWGLPTPLTSASFDRLVGSLEVDSSAFRRAVPDWQPIPAEEGWRQTSEWYLHARGSHV
jgi:UDP-N-acetyl-alpha-D-quinovosamine dehydrogenase